AQRAIERIRAATAEAWDLAQKLEDVVGSFCLALRQRPYHVHRYSGFA
ncbi:MAG: hypothetical protein HY521_06525, partial [Proteobacteria bacterium]|nr:hypothetical protein [Pseudomonadota bacterium]MBI4183633.1 hypothetical protein [Pseudomonadota bacterium]